MGVTMKKKHDWVFVLPAILVVAVMTQVPFILTIVYSTLRWNLARPDMPIKFAGIDNYLYFMRIENWKEIPEFYSIVWQTVMITGLTLAICTITGFLMSLLLDTTVPGVNFARTLILGPFFVMSTASGVIWKTTILNTTFGWYGVIAKALGFTSVDLLSYYPIPVIIFLFVWQWMPFFVLVILAGLQGISFDLIDSMRIDGVNWFQATFLIKLPMITNHIRVAVMLGLIFIVKEFGLILVTTAGGPGTRSYTLPYAVYMEVFNASNVGRASALATMTVAMTLIAVNMLYRSLKKRSAI
ncbi:MAG: sugar ABC transporter permease [Treponema sp. GWB1_62_6]|nr:MAG: sugar ABC transporter permease [Treponema sp. GWC1_61_84]OHE70834.1 MAG: sugar ABC transporter permease [Treponema sp. GWB1_62_6]OHE74770.1 MAG: sugar ABC transporter permease [Treponema sp. RIFOXYC1_FULL_61_9]HCM28705.1 sugar ABC transporter permease [Treponema sp.]